MLALVVVCVVFQLILSKTKFGRHVYAVGGNATAARLSGVNVTAVTITVFVLSGLLAGFAGPIDAAYSASADPLAGTVVRAGRHRRGRHRRARAWPAAGAPSSARSSAR